MRAWTLSIGQPSSCPTFGVYGLDIPQDPTIKLTPDCVTVHYEEIGLSRHFSVLPSFCRINSKKRLHSHDKFTVHFNCVVTDLKHKIPDAVPFERFEMPVGETPFEVAGDYWGDPLYKSTFELWSPRDHISVQLQGPNAEEALRLLRLLKLIGAMQHG
jgi:hypothetical protein